MEDWIEIPAHLTEYPVIVPFLADFTMANGAMLEYYMDTGSAGDSHPFARSNAESTKFWVRGDVVEELRDLSARLDMLGGNHPASEALQ